MKSETIKKYLMQLLSSSTIIPWALLVIITAVFTIVLYPSLIEKHLYYKLGDVAERDIKAPRDFFIEDKEATETKRKQVLDEILTVYDHDVTLSLKLRNQVKTAFEEMRAIYQSEAEKQNAKSNPENTEIPDDAVSLQPPELTIHEKLWQKKEAFEEKLGISVSKGAFTILEKQEFSTQISDLMIQIISQIMDNGVVANKEVLLRESDQGILLRAVQTKTEKISTNLRQYHGLDQAKTMVRIIAQPLVKDLHYNLTNLIVDFCQRLIQPNITLNRNETEERKKRALAEIKPVLHKVKAGEMILREGERVTEYQLLKLKNLAEQKREEKIYAKNFGAVALLIILICIKYFIHLNHTERPVTNRNIDLLFLTCILISFFFLTKLSTILFEAIAHNSPFPLSVVSLCFGIPLSAATMTVCLFLGIQIAIPFALMVSVCCAVLLQDRFEMFIYFALSCSVAAFWMQSCKERKVFIKAGLKLGFLNIVFATAVAIFMGDYAGIKLLWDWIFGFIAGVSAGVITAGLAPLLEIAFGYTTDITLLELANLERPILRRLMMEAPGTYHHSVIVGSMVEAAAAEIGANPLLAKVCGYYHDIGKLKKPLYFIENQTDGVNRHDKLAPSMSGLILISHVKHGVEIGREHRLGGVILDTIRQHHGTSLITYFYEKARQLKGEDAVKINDYRYPGPKPQTREAGLVMLADVVEAASRTLSNPTPSRIQGLVQTLINKIFSDGQLENCELTLKDLHAIAKSFNKILNGIHHHRIEYPEKSSSGNGKEKKEQNGRTDKQQPKQTKDKSGSDRDDGSGHLKRLGVS